MTDNWAFGTNSENVFGVVVSLCSQLENSSLLGD
jgi:hypothetical protein